MPAFTIDTNVPRSKIPADFLKTTSALLAKTLGKPESYCAVAIHPDTLMTWGGTDAPCALGKIISLGQLGAAENQKHSKALFAHIEKTLGVPGDRFYLQFVDEDPANLGYTGTTFESILNRR